MQIPSKLIQSADRDIILLTAEYEAGRIYIRPRSLFRVRSSISDNKYAGVLKAFFIDDLRVYEHTEMYSHKKRGIRQLIYHAHFEVSAEVSLRGHDTASVDISTLEAYDIMLPQNVGFGVPNDAVSYSK
jgi:hypothetical protein